MVAYASSLFADAALSTIKNNVDLMTVTAGQPNSYGSCVAGSKFLASITVSGADFTIASHASGRQLTVGQKTGASVNTSGGGNHINLLSTSGSVQRYGTTATSQQLTAGNALTVNSWLIVVKDPNK